MLKKNMQALEKYHNKLYKKIKDIKTNNTLEIIEAKNGSPSLKFKGEEGDLFIHSKYNPEKEAKRYVSKIDIDRKDAISILGCGLGYHVLEIYKKVKEKDVKLFIFESNYLIFYKLLKFIDFRPLFKDNNCFFIVENDESKIDIFKDIGLEFEDTFFKELTVFEWKPLVSTFSEYYTNIKEQLFEFKKHLYTNQNTLTHFAKEWNENLLKNIKSILFDPGFNFISNIYKDVPIVVVAAGPSLDKNIDLLAEIKNKAVIITVSNALKSLLNKNIIPDFVVVSDSSKSVEDHFPDFKNDMLKKIVLAYDPVISPKILNNWPGMKIVASPHKADKILNWVEKFSNYKGRVFFGGSVAHAAFSLAYYLGGNPIILVGQDLALSDGYTHAKGSNARKTAEDNMVNRKKAGYNNSFFEIDNIYGDKVLTRGDYYNYLKWFNRTFKQIKRVRENFKIIDATEGGAKIKNTKIMKLRDAIDRYCVKDYDIKYKLFNSLHNYKNKIDKNIINELEKIIEDLAYLENLSQKGLNIIDEIIDNLYSTSFIEESKSIIKDINKKINKLTKSLMLFEFEFYDTFSERIDKQINKHLNRSKNVDNDLHLNLLSDYYFRIKKGSNFTQRILNKNLNLLKSKVNN